MTTERSWKTTTTSIRDIELSLSREEEWIDIPYPKATQKRPPEGMQGEPEIKAMLKMILAAWQTDATRVVTYRMPDAGLPAEHGDLFHATHAVPTTVPMCRCTSST